MKKREVIPRDVRDQVMKEFNHRCALCGRDRPHLHHIDENPGNNETTNLIPLCPSCHLSDQHDASNAVPREKLRFFRRFKHRLILKPQFNSLWRRLHFLHAIGDADEPETLEARGNELVSLVLNLPMGTFFGQELHKRLERPSRPRVWVLGDRASDARHSAERLQDAQEYRDQLRSAVPEIEALVVELLDHQTWGEPES